MKKLVCAMFISCLLGLGCDQSSTATSSGEKVPAGSIKGPGVVKGKIVFKGTAPVLPALKNEPCCDGAPATLKDESVIVNSNGTLANVVVYIQGGPKADGKDLPSAKLDQKFCQYIPHVVPVVTGQNLHITSSDPTIHNVHYTGTFVGDQNKWIKTPSEFIDVSFSKPEPIVTKCDVHNWMKAYIFVVDTPLHAITGEDGSFNIANIPAGDYTLSAWHERYGRKDTKISVKDGTPLELDVTFEPPAQ